MNLVNSRGTILIHRNHFNTYTITMKGQKKKLRIQSYLPFQQQEKYLEINISKEKKDLYTENYKILIKEIK